MDKDNWKKFYEICGVSIGDTVIVDMEELNIESDGIYTVTTEDANDYMEDLLKGNFTIKPWKPYKGQSYYTVMPCGEIRECTFYPSSKECMFDVITGNIFKTEERAKANEEYIKKVVFYVGAGMFEKFKIIEF